MIQGVLFDMDGVLIDSEPISNRLLAEVCALQGCVLTSEQLQHLLGTNLDTCNTLLTAWFPGRIDTSQYVADWIRLMLQHIQTQGLPAKPGVTEALNMLRQRGVPMAVCTSNDSRIVQAVADNLPFFQSFQTIVTGDQVTHGKPAPDIFLEGARRLGVPPEQCAGIEDSLNGVKSIRAAGMMSVMIPDTLPFGPSFAPYTDVTIPSLLHLEKVLFPSR